MRTMKGLRCEPVTWMLAKVTRLLGQREGPLLLTAGKVSGCLAPQSCGNAGGLGGTRQWVCVTEENLSIGNPNLF